MAEALPGVVGKQMLSKVLSLAADEVSLAWGFKDELKRLEKSLEMVQALLSDAAENKKSQLKAVKLWLNNLNVVAYDADAVLDEFTYETLRRKVENRKRDKVRALFSPSKNPLSFRLNMAHKIKNVNESLDEIYKEGIRIGLVKLVRVTEATIEHSEIRLTHPCIDDSEVVGRDGDVSKIVDMLFCPDNGKNLSVIAIVGMAGQGKKTVAQLVCKHHKVKGHFDETIWVVVSEDFDEIRLLNEMVESLTKNNSQMTNLGGIIKKLGDEMGKKRYLLVLDDVWSHDANKWDCMRNALLGVGGSSGSKVMVTTRSEQVVSSMQTSVTHRLGRLSEEDSWTMFKHRAFAEGGAVETENLVDIGREMVKRCGGLPLAIKALGGLMYSKKSKPAEWSSIQGSRLWNMEDNMGGVLPALKLSYDHLPSLLKHCFALSSIFPKDFDLEKSNLIQLWMALGLLHPTASNFLMEDIGNDYFNTLFLNSLLQDAKKDEYDSITSCKMHDVVHDLALDMAKNYCSTLDARQPNDVSDVVHLSLIYSLRKIPKILTKISSRLQTLILKAGLDGKLLANFKCLRVLVLDNYRISELPDSIGQLKHLRYLDISKTQIVSLPDTITKLYSLQTLRLQEVLDVPKKFSNLISLRHFCIGDVVASRQCMLIGIGRLTYLQTLPFFVVNQHRGCHIKELGSLKNLRGNLTIFGLEQVDNSGEAKQADLSKKSRLLTLKLCWVRNNESSKNKVCNDEHVLEGLQPHLNLEGLTIENFGGGKFPSWMMMESQSSSVLRNLVKIQLCDCNGCDRILPLGHLQYLKVVEIFGMDNVKVIGAEFYGGDASSSSGATEITLFPALRELTLKQMPRLEKWLEAAQQSGSVSVFPCLEKLMIQRCSSLVTIPHHFPSLRKLSIFGCSGFSYLPNNLQADISDLTISGCPNLSCLPNNLEALERLSLDNCKNLRDIPLVPSLREISISGCEKFIGLPSLTQFFPVVENLDIEDCPNLTSVPELCTSLQSLRIHHCKGLTSLPEELGTVLNELHIGQCPAMVTFPDFRYLRKLKLSNNSKELDYFPWPSCSSSTSTTSDVAVGENGDDVIQCLEHVELEGWPQIKSLPDQLQHLSALTYLELDSFHGLKSLPEWLGNLSSLHSLSIFNCEKLMYMPSVEAMRRLTKLSQLTILLSPLLEDRCIDGSRPEWEKISHITTIYIGGKLISKIRDPKQSQCQPTLTSPGCNKISS